ncbi:thiamine ABC transporter substrate-binding protein [Natronoglomus mannanivorans]|uniref:Thiamine ABC transporter substrate-binding protein n=1 Tax=Natronoglomus mannanivorans TaxID=2979990 RepID=A0AAP3E300_9EURY|nr:thiamine ABC transporter substrate-binding protein [Halobacteria archaeon AArc-xg1-1]
MDRRTFIRTVSGGTAGIALAGCLTQDDDENGNGEDDENGNGNGEDDENGNGNDNGNETDNGDEEEQEDEPDLEGTLRVATYTSMVDDEEAAGTWLKDAFEEEYPDATIDWTVPEEGTSHYIQQANQGVDIDADVFLGLNVDDLVLIDDNTDESLFRSVDRDRLEHVDRIRDDPSVEFDDPHDRVLPYDTGYISLVYDENEVDDPETFDALTDEEYEGTLITQNAQQSDPGQAFLLWTIDAYGEDGYLDYWEELLDNDVRIIDDWSSAYSAYENEERPMVVSYSTDQVYTNRFDGDMSRSQIGFLEEQGYANPEGMAIFEDSEQVDLANAFLDFVLSNEAQAEIAVRNVQFPAVADEYVDLDEDYAEYAHEPPEAVSLTYDELSGNLDEWVDDWGQLVASR